MYRIEYERAAQKELARLPHVIQARIIDAIEALADDPRPPGNRKVVGTSRGHRIRVGDFRVLYDIEDDILVIVVIRVGRRDKAYRRT